MIWPADKYGQVGTIWFFQNLQNTNQTVFISGNRNIASNLKSCKNKILFQASSCTTNLHQPFSVSIYVSCGVSVLYLGIVRLQAYDWQNNSPVCWAALMNPVPKRMICQECGLKFSIRYPEYGIPCNTIPEIQEICFQHVTQQGFTDPDTSTC